MFKFRGPRLRGPGVAGKGLLMPLLLSGLHRGQERSYTFAEPAPEIVRAPTRRKRPDTGEKRTRIATVYDVKALARALPDAEVELEYVPASSFGAMIMVGNVVVMVKARSPIPRTYRLDPVDAAFLYVDCLAGVTLDLVDVGGRLVTYKV